MASVTFEGGQGHLTAYLTGEIDQSPDLNRLYDALSELFFELQLRDETRLRRSVWERAGDDTLRGLFLMKLKKQFDAAGTEEQRDRKSVV